VLTDRTCQQTTQPDVAGGADDQRPSRLGLLDQDRTGVAFDQLQLPVGVRLDLREQTGNAVSVRLVDLIQRQHALVSARPGPEWPAKGMYGPQSPAGEPGVLSGPAKRGFSPGRIIKADHNLVGHAEVVLVMVRSWRLTPAQARIAMSWGVLAISAADMEGFGRMACMTGTALRKAAHCRAVAPG
jgi:hypothetical protein